MRPMLAILDDSRGLERGVEAVHFVLSKGVLSYLIRSYFDEVAPSDADDWLSMVRTARATPMDRVEDAIAALTATGPLIPATTTGPGR